MTSEWRHVRSILMQNKDLLESLSWTQFLSFNQFLCMEWHIVDRPNELLSRVFKIFRKKTVWQIFKKKKMFWIFFHFWGVFIKTGIYLCYRKHQHEQVWKISVIYETMSDLYTTIRSSVSRSRKSAYNLNAYLTIFQMSHNKINGTIGFWSSNCIP